MLVLLLPLALGIAPVDDVARLVAARPPARDQAALARAFNRVRTQLPAATPATRIGDTEQLWVADIVAARQVPVIAELRYADANIRMLFDTSARINQQTIDSAAARISATLLPALRVRLDAPRDPRPITILHTRLRGAAGYFTPENLLSQAVNPFSNERLMIVMTLNDLTLGSQAYDATIVHELTHLIDSVRGGHNGSWIAEGLAVYSEDEQGIGGNGFARAYLTNADLQLTSWSLESGRSTRHYGAAQLFMRYVAEQYGTAPLRALLAVDGNDAERVLVRAAQQRHPDIASFADLYADWAVANVYEGAAARFRYALRPERARSVAVTAGQSAGIVPQFGAQYLALNGPLTLTFRGAQEVSLTGAPPPGGQWAWWSQRGDERATTLTRTLDLRRVARATLTMRVWHALERDYDYAFVSASSDGGRSWRTLAGATTVTTSPQGTNYGDAFTGLSGAQGSLSAPGIARWLDERFDLTPYAGRQVQLRFWVATDASVNGPGVLIDDLAVPEIGWRDDVERGDAGWQAAGFVRAGATLPQRWILRLVRPDRIERIVVDAAGLATLRLAAGERATLLIAGATPLTTEPARYAITTEP